MSEDVGVSFWWGGPFGAFIESRPPPLGGLWGFAPCPG